MFFVVSLILSCSSDEKKASDISSTESVETDQEIIEETEPQEPAEEETHPEDAWDTTGELPPCDIPLTISPDTATVAPGTGILFLGEGGTGNRFFAMDETADLGDLNPTTGFFTAADAEGAVHRVQVFDSQCAGHASAEITVSAGLSILPESVRVPPSTPVTVAITGDSGDVSCDFIQNNSGAILDGDCQYIAGAVDGTDLIRVLDNQTLEMRTLFYKVESGATLTASAKNIVLIEGSEFHLTTLAGSGYLEVTGSDETIFSTDGNRIVADALGYSLLSVQDRYTSLQQDVHLRIVAPLVGDSDRWGVSTNLKGEFHDLNGDGHQDFVVGMANLGYKRAASGLVAVYLGSAAGLETQPAQILGKDAAPIDYFGGDFTTGDFNGDGLTDILVSASGSSGGGIDLGAAYLHLGVWDGDNLFEDTASQMFTGASSWYFMGTVASCDIDGDGIDDLIIGDRYRFSVYIGRAGPFTNEADYVRATKIPDGNGGFFEYNSASWEALPGDFNGDGYCDVAMSSWNGVQDPNTGAITTTGRLYQIYLGSTAGLSENPDWNMIPEGDFSNLSAIPKVIDIQDDGTDELLLIDSSFDLSAETSSTYNGFIGLAGDFSFGTTDGWNDIKFIISSPSHYKRVGSGSDVGDLDQDGFPDLFLRNKALMNLADPNWETLYTQSEGYIDWDELVLEDIVVGEEPHAASLFRVGDDWNQDGERDLLVVSSDDGNGLGVPQLWMLDQANGHVAIDAPGDRIGDLQGTDSVFIDMDGDGVRDAVFSAPQASSSDDGFNVGFIYYSTLDGDSFSQVTKWEPAYEFRANSDALGRVLNAETDYDGDGYDDLAIVLGRSYQPTNYTDAELVGDCDNSGSATLYIHRGGPDGVEPIPSWIQSITRNYVYSLRGGLDINGDGLEDYLIGSNISTFGFGLQWVLGMDTPERLTISCDSNIIYRTDEYAVNGIGSGFGRKSAPIGDLDGDGCDEFAVTSIGEQSLLTPFTWHKYPGAVHVIWGWGQNCNSTEIQYTPLTNDHRFALIGYSIAGGHDIDGDGVPDFLTSSIQFENSFQSTGTVWMTSGASLIDLPRYTLLDNTIESAGELIVEIPYEELISNSHDALSGKTLTDFFGTKIRLVTSPSGETWLAVSSPEGDLGSGDLSGGIELYRFDTVTQLWERTPEVIIAGHHLDQQSSIGENFQFGWIGDELWISAGMPFSDTILPDLGAAIFAPIDLANQ